jgi:hypothetical protein
LNGGLSAAVEKTTGSTGKEVLLQHQPQPTIEIILEEAMSFTALEEDLCVHISFE